MTECWAFLLKYGGIVGMIALCGAAYVGLRDANRVVKHAEDFVKQMPDNRREKQ